MHANVDFSPGEIHIFHANVDFSQGEIHLFPWEIPHANVDFSTGEIQTYTQSLSGYKRFNCLESRFQEFNEPLSGWIQAIYLMAWNPDSRNLMSPYLDTSDSLLNIMLNIMKKRCRNLMSPYPDTSSLNVDEFIDNPVFLILKLRKQGCQ